jgi:type IV pilus assembly protein PilN
MIRVNLLGTERPTKRSGGGGTTKRAPSAPGAVQAYLFLTLFAGGAIVLCAAGYWWKSMQIRNLDAEIAKAEQRQRELQAIKAQVDALEAKRATFQRKVDLIERLKAEQSAPVHMLDEISKSLPDFVWLVAVDQGGSAIRFSGQANGMPAVADFIGALQRSGWFPQVELGTFAETSNVATFDVNAQFKSPEVAAKEAAAREAAAAAARAAAAAPRQ